MTQRLLAALACAMAMLACANDARQPCTACTAGHIVGVAAGGAPVVGTLAVVDCAGARRSVTISRDGSYSVDVTGLIAPYLLEAAGTVGGRATVLRSLAVGEDVGINAVNVTPLTELLTAYVLSADPRALFDEPPSNLKAETLLFASTLVARQLAPLLSAYGVGGADVRTAEFATNGLGMDGALDAMHLTPIQDRDTGAPRYQLAVASVADPITVDPARLQDLSLRTVDPGTLSRLAAVLPEVDARLQALAATFADGVPAAEALAPFFASGFLHNGLDLDGYVSAVLRQPRFAGSAFSHAAVEELDGAGRVRVSFVVTFASRDTKRISWWMQKTGGAWVIEGNGTRAEVGVSYLARLTTLPLTRDELQTHGDELLFGLTSDDRLCYAPRGTSPPIPTCQGDWGNNFGNLALAGYWPYTNSDEVPDNRERTRTLTRNLGRPSSRVRPYIVLYVSSTEHDPAVDHVVVTGPGLPAAGLTLTPPKPGIPRDHMILQGDLFDWNAFDSDRCREMSPAPPGCALDWKQVKAGATYEFALYDAPGAASPFAVEEAQLLGRPRPADEWFADKDRLFPRFDLAPAQHHTMANILDQNGCFVPGGTLPLRWVAPQDPSVSLHSLWAWRQYYLGDTGAEADAVKESHYYSLLGVTDTAQDVVFDTLPGGVGSTAWAWSTLVARDVYGNELDHEVGPENPY